MSYKIDNVDVDAWDNMVKRLKREDCFIHHNRTGELILGCTNEKHPNFNPSGHLKRFTAVAYHRQVNKQNSATIEKKVVFAVSPRGVCTIIPKIVNGSQKVGKPTSQFKTVWFSKHMRRQ